MVLEIGMKTDILCILEIDVWVITEVDNKCQYDFGFPKQDASMIGVGAMAAPVVLHLPCSPRANLWPSLHIRRLG